MPTFQFSKLVRNNIVKQQRDSGAIPSYRRLAPDEHKQELVKKIIEEAREIGQAPAAEIASEIADVQQALDDLARLHNLSTEDIAAAQAEKYQKSGGFDQGIFVEHVEVDAQNKWIEYYRNNPERYPDISN